MKRSDLVKLSVQLGALVVCTATGGIPGVILGSAFLPKILDGVLGSWATEIIDKIPIPKRLRRKLNPLGQPNHDLNKALEAAIAQALQEYDLEKKLRDGTNSFRDLKPPYHSELETYCQQLLNHPEEVIKIDAQNDSLKNFLQNPNSDTFAPFEKFLDADALKGIPEKLRAKVVLELHVLIAARFWDQVKNTPAAWNAYASEVFAEFRVYFTDIGKELNALGENQQAILDKLAEREATLLPPGQPPGLPPAEVVAAIESLQHVILASLDALHLKVDGLHVKMDVVISQVDKLTDSQKVTAERIRAHLQEASETALENDLKQADTQTEWREGERLKLAARAAHQQRLTQIDSYAAEFAILESSADATEEARKLVQIARDKGVQEALQYLDYHRANILSQAQAQVATFQQRLRRTLQPLLSGIDLAKTAEDHHKVQALYQDILKADPTWHEVRYDFVLFLLYTSGPKAQIHENLERALAIYQMAERQARLLTATDDSNQDWLRDLFVSYSKLGDVAVARGELEDAAVKYAEGVKISEQLTKSDPTNSEWQRDLSVSYDKLGNVAVARGQLEEAAEKYAEGVKIREKLRKSDSTNSEWQRGLSVSYNKLGDVAVARGQLEEAADKYAEGVKIREKLTKTDPTNSQWQRDLSVSYEKLGNVAVARGQLEEAADKYAEGLKISEKLTKTDPTNSQWQRDLFVSYNKQGDVAVARGQLDEAAEKYAEGLKISEKLTKSAPTNSQWQRDLSVSYDNLGNVAVVRGQLDEAAKKYAEGLKICKKLTKTDPTNSEWQRDLFVSYDNLGNVAVARGELEEAADKYAEGLKISEQLTKSDPTNSQWQRDLSVSYDKLGNVAVARGQLEEAAKKYAEGLKIREKLTKSDPTNSEWQRDLSVSYDKLGNVAVARGQLEEAADKYAEGLKISEQLTKSDPTNSEWQLDVYVSHYKIADLAERQLDAETAAKHWQMAYDVLKALYEEGKHVSPSDLKFLEFLKTKVKNP